MDIFTIYYSVALLSMLAMLYRYRKHPFCLLLVLMAFTGVASFFIPRGTQYANVIYVCFAVYLFCKHTAWKQFQLYKWVAATFALFSTYFIVDNLILSVDILTLFSQYSKYFIPFICFALFIYYAIYDRRSMAYINRLVGELLVIQCLFGLLKWILMGGHFWEGMVGTFTGVKGGGAGTGFPLVALCWVAVNSNMNIKHWYSWVLILGLLFVGIAAGKRAVIILYPLLFLLLAVFVCRKKYSRHVWVILCAVPLMFYLGVRLTPTLNPENKVWGTFDLDYMLNYTEDYTAGEADEEGNREEYEGRLGSVKLFWDIARDFDHYTSKVILGEGVQRAYYSTEDREAYDKFGRDYGLHHRGELTGIFMQYIAIGLLGVLLFIIYYFTLFRMIKYKRLFITFFAIVMFDYVCYNFTTVRDPFVNTLLMFTMVYSLLQYTPQGTFVGEIHPYFQPKLRHNHRKVKPYM